MDALARFLLVVLEIICLTGVFCWQAVKAMRWARKGGAAKKILSFGLLFLAVPAIAEPPQQTVIQVAEERKRNKDRKSEALDVSDQSIAG